MIKKMRRRYLILIMALLSGTLLLCLAILFGFLYHAEVSSSYTVMQEMIKGPGFRGKPPKDGVSAPEGEPPDFGEKPNADPQNDSLDAVIEPLLYQGEGLIAQPLHETENNKGDQGNWNHYDPFNPYNPFSPFNPFNPYNPYNPYSPYYPNNPYNPYNPYAPSDSGEDNSVPDDRQDKQERDDREDKQDHPPAVPGTLPATAPTQPAATTTAAAGTAGSSRTRREEPRDPQPPEGGIVPPGETDINEHRPNPMTPPPVTTAVTQTTTVSKTTGTTSVPTTSVAAPASTTAANTTTVQIVPVEEGRYIPDAFIAEFDSDGKLSSYAGNDRDASEDESFRRVNHAMDEVMRRGEESGTVQIGENSYRFLYQPDEEGHYRLVLMDRAAEKSTLKRLLFIFLLIAAVGLVLAFGVSMLLANWTVTPVETAWEKQKQFVADASHELKTPLAVISANTEVILANPNESVAEQSKWLNYIQSETMRMSKLITVLLSVARMENKRNVREHDAPIQLSETVSNVCLVFEPIIYENGKTLNTVIQRNVSLCADEDNIKQLLSILLDNAVLHSVPKAQITVSLSKDAQGKIRLAVANTAKDIPPEQLAHLYDRFYRVDTDCPNGSGLGLSIAKSIVHQLGGTLSVTSENQVVTFVALFS